MRERNKEVVETIQAYQNHTDARLGQELKTITER